MIDVGLDNMGLSSVGFSEVGVFVEWGEICLDDSNHSHAMDYNLGYRKVNMKAPTLPLRHHLGQS